MKSRAQKINRIVAMRRLQYRLSEWQLIQLRQREQELQDQQTRLVGALNDSQLLKVLSSEIIARRLMSASVSAQGVHERIEQQREQLRTEAKRLKDSERIVELIAGAERRVAEKRSLDELTEALAAKSIGQAWFNLESKDIRVERE